MRKLFLAICLLPIAAMAQFTEDSIFFKRIADDILKNGKAYELLRELTKGIGGRLAGSEQFTKAVQWGKKSLIAANADTVFLQPCIMPNWKRGGTDKATIVKIGNKNMVKPLNTFALGNSIGTGGKNVTANVVVVNNFDELDAIKDKVKGKIVFYCQAFNPTFINPGRNYGAVGVFRRQGASRAAKYGAAAIIVRSLTEATDNNAHTGTMVYNDSFPKIPAFAIGIQDADYLETIGRKETITVTLNSFAKFYPDVEGHNVVAEIKGSEYANEYITVGGHLDSWDVNEGAHDDGAGVVQTIEIARVFKALGYTPKRNIRFVLFANEENGLAGGKEYAAQAKQKNEQHIFALESDAGGFTPRGFGFSLNNADQYKKVMAWKELFEPYGASAFQRGGGGADIGPLNTLFKTPVAGLNPDGQRYFDVHHAVTDVFENVHKRELLLGAINMAALIYMVDKYGL
jgi:carboxypeptidase Q